MINDEGETIDLYIPRKWCLPFLQQFATAYGPYHAQTMDLSAALMMLES
jgi:hypothetical protein